MQTFAPAFAKRKATANPIPRDPPDTNTVGALASIELREIEQY